jgi:hypothetical protein
MKNGHLGALLNSQEELDKLVKERDAMLKN